MWQKIRKDLNYFTIYTAMGVVAFLINFLLNHFFHVAISYRVHFLFFLLNFISLSTILLKAPASRHALKWFSLVLKILVLAVVVLTVKSFKSDVFWYFGIYWYHLIVQTVVEIRYIKSEDKSHELYRTQKL